MTYSRKGGLVTTHCALIDFMEQIKDKMDPRYIDMIEEELKLGGTILRHITSEDDTVQIEHLTNYFYNIDMFLGKIWKGVEPDTRAAYLNTNMKSVSHRLEERKDEMELKYSSVATAELKIVQGCIEKHALDEDPRAREHLHAVVNNVDLYISKSIAKGQPKPKK